MIDSKIENAIFEPPYVATLAMQQIERERNNPDSGLRFGIPQIDDHFVMARKGKFIGVLADTSHGKSAFLKFAARSYESQLEDDEIGIYVTWEDTVEDFGITDLSAISGVPIGSVYNGDATEADYDKILRAQVELSKSKLWVVGHSDAQKTFSPRLTMTDIMLVMENLLEKQKKRVRFVMFDYLQLVNLSDLGRNDRRIQFNDAIAKMRDLAKGYGTTVFCATQVKRDVQDRRWNQPQAHDAMETSGFEQACDAMLSLWYVHRSPNWELGKTVYEPQRVGEIGISVTKDLMMIETLKQKRGDAKVSRAIDFVPEYNQFVKYRTGDQYRVARKEQR